MKYIIAITVAVLLSLAAWADDSQAVPGFGTITWRTARSVKSVRIIATATNESTDYFLDVRLCIQGVNAKANNCAGAFERRGIWSPGESFSWDENLRRPAKSGAYKIVPFLADKLTTAKLIDRVEGIFVEQPTGADTEMMLEQLQALIINSHRFKLVEDLTLADAILQGRVEIWKSGSTVSTSSSGQTATSGGILALRAAAVGGAVSNGASQGTTKTTFDSAEAIVLRLTFRTTGESIWAWDDSTDCAAPKSKAKCAIDDLVAIAAHPLLPPIR